MSYLLTAVDSSSSVRSIHAVRYRRRGRFFLVIIISCLFSVWTTHTSLSRTWSLILMLSVGIITAAWHRPANDPPTKLHTSPEFLLASRSCPSIAADAPASPLSLTCPFLLAFASSMKPYAVNVCGAARKKKKVNVKKKKNAIASLLGFKRLCYDYTKVCTGVYRYIRSITYGRKIKSFLTQKTWNINYKQK